MRDQLLIESESDTAVLEADETVEVIAGPMIKPHDHGHPGVRNGVGACSASGCYCQAYSGNAYTCANCGHNYATHW